MMTQENGYLKEGEFQIDWRIQDKRLLLKMYKLLKARLMIKVGKRPRKWKTLANYFSWIAVSLLVFIS